MPSYRPLISRDKFHQLESYYFRLVQFTISAEFKELNSQKQLRIHQEINYIGMALNIMNQIFCNKDAVERPVVGWMENDERDQARTIYSFSCIKVAAMSLGLNNSKIAMVCKGLRKSTGGQWEVNPETGHKEWKNAWVFQYKEKFEEEQNHTFDPNGTKFEFK